MLAALLITLREGLEAALLVGIVLALLRQTDAHRREARLVWAGVGAAVAISLTAGTVLFTAGTELDGTAEQLFEAAVMLTAAGLLTWMIFWMQRRSRSLKADLEGKVGTAVLAGGAALFWLAFTIILREGLETSLFLMASASGQRSLGEVVGGVTGLVLAGALGYAVFRGGLRLDLRRLFIVLNVVLLAFAAYLVWGGIAELGELAGGDAGEVIGPVAAAVYATVMLWSYARTTRRRSAAAGPAAVRAVRGRPGAD